MILIRQFLFICILVMIHINFKTFGFDSGSADVSIIGLMNFADGLGKVSISFVDCLKNTGLTINWKSTRSNAFVLDKKYHGREMYRMLSPKKFKPGKVAVFTDQPWDILNNHAKALPEESIVKIIYSMLESSGIPPQWVDIINSKFDLVVVPDEFLVNVYKSCGVTKPIMVLPLVMYLDEFLERRPRFEKGRNKQFVFGNMSGALPHKNQEILIRAFGRLFKGKPDVKLVINSRGGATEIIEQTRKLIDELGLSNIEYRINNLSWDDYISFMESLDCYVSFSCGEGYSMAPREALALGIPVIISNNTAHSTLCNTGCVCSVASAIAKPAYYSGFKQVCGNYFYTDLKEAIHAMVHVYACYDSYLEKARQGREWVKKYRFESLKDKYISLVKPARVVLTTDKNEIRKGSLLTSSRELFDKYRELGCEGVIGH